MAFKLKYKIVKGSPFKQTVETDVDKLIEGGADVNYEGDNRRTITENNQE